MRRSIIAAIFVLTTTPTLAQAPAVPPGAIVAAPDGGLFISPAICKALAVAPADVVPGVDVHGRAVAPADLPAAQGEQTDIAIAVAPDLRRRYAVSPQSRLARGRGVIGYVTLGNGQPMLNGAPLAGDERALLTAACQQAKH
jgi:hypothetical protein